MEHHKTEQDVKKNLEDIGFSEQEILLFFQYQRASECILIRERNSGANKRWI